MRILLVEDTKEISDFLKASLEAEYFAVDVADDGEKGSSLGRINDYDLAILDYVLPKKDGKQVCQEIRKKKKDLPIIMLSVKSDPISKVELLDMGADDYITKPFSLEELLARIRALFRRQKRISQKILTAGNITLDIKKHLVTQNEKEIYLTRKEFMLLELLMKKQGEVVSRGNMIEHAWDMNADPFSNTIETHIRCIRKKLGDNKLKKIIITVPGRGYKISTK